MLVGLRLDLLVGLDACGDDVSDSVGCLLGAGVAPSQRLDRRQVPRLGASTAMTKEV